VDFNQRYSLRTGINYFTYGYLAKRGYNPCPYCVDALPTSGDYSRLLFTSSLLLPVHFMVYRNVAKGRFIFSIGPDVYLPINSFGKEITTFYPGQYSTDRIHYHFNTTDFFKGGSLGFTLGLGYEKKLSKGLAIEFMPDFRVLNIVPFDFQQRGLGVYQNYIFNMALGLSTYITFY
jgi:hypothetical protein